MPSAKFEELFSKVKQLDGDPSNEQLLNLYAWGKVAKGVSIEGKSRPGIFDPTGRYKYDAWKKAEDEGLSAEEAEQKYIALAEELIARIGLKAPGQA